MCLKVLMGLQIKEEVGLEFFGYRLEVQRRVGLDF